MTGTYGCTLEEFAHATSLPVSFLIEAGAKKCRPDRRPAVRFSDSIIYLAPPSPDGEGVVERIERKDRRPAPFGIDSLPTMTTGGSVYLLADEIEALTLRFYGLPALAVPPVTRWPEEWPALDETATVFVVFSGVADRSAPPAWIAEAPFRDRARLLQLAESRTANMLHRSTPSHFHAAWKSVCETAIS